MSRETRESTHRQMVVAVAASAGGLNAISEILSRLPAGFGAPVLALLHLDPRHKSLLPVLLARSTPLPVVGAADGMELVPGHVYVASPDRHLTVDAGHRVRLTATPRVHFTRPSADELFTSIANAYGPAAIGVLCSGTGVDGADGLGRIQARGGMTIAQDRSTSEYFGMPGEAISRGVASVVLPLYEIPGRLVALVGAGNDEER